jgi:phage tail sheath protein FI
MTGGTNGVSETAISFGNTAIAYDQFNNTEQYDIAFILQGKANTGTNLANYIISNIVESRKDCILFVSPARDLMLSGNNVLASRNAIITNLIAYRNALQSSSYWFMDTGYKYRFDKYNNTFRWVPMNGDMAGLAARVDPWESPAGYKRGIIKNVIKLAFNPNKAERDRLYGSDINSVISQAGQGTLLFGDKTGLGRSSAFDRLNVRRLFIVVEKAIATVSASLLFDFNDEFTQTEFRNLVDPFLRDIKGKRGITDFRVVSDSRVNTPDVIDRNIFRANIFIKPARTINYIELTFIATRTGISFEELVGQQF